jgi:hypothetical protein
MLCRAPQEGVRLLRAGHPTAAAAALSVHHAYVVSRRLYLPNVHVARCNLAAALLACNRPEAALGHALGALKGIQNRAAG